jgi:hypothetical protein
MSLSFLRNLIGSGQKQTVPPDSVRPPDAKIHSNERDSKADPNIPPDPAQMATAKAHSTEEYLFFRPWGKQHERLKISKRDCLSFPMTKRAR